jgi:hypothetical protein
MSVAQSEDILSVAGRYGHHHWGWTPLENLAGVSAAFSLSLFAADRPRSRG